VALWRHMRPRRTAYVVFPHDCPGEGVLYGTVKLGGHFCSELSCVTPGTLAIPFRSVFSRGSFGGVTPRDTLVLGCETDLPSLPTVRLAQNTDPTQTPPVYYSTPFWQGRGARARQGKSPRAVGGRIQSRVRSHRVSVRSRYKSYNRMLSSTANQASAKHPPGEGARRGPRAAMALAALSGDEQSIIFSQLCNAHARHSVPPAVTLAGVAVAFTLQVRV
jgi:hypothetical protein